MQRGRARLVLVLDLRASIEAELDRCFDAFHTLPAMGRASQA
jgi:hypothetical protein